ncbi:MAG: DMT family transporter [Chloroflexota bacterium]
MGILLGVTAAFGWGAASFIGRQTTQVLGAVSALLFSQLISFITILSYLLLSGELVMRINGSQWQWWAWSALAATIHTMSLIMVFRSFEVGVLSVVAPIAGSYSAVTVFLSYLSGEILTPLNALGIALAITGVMLVAIKPRPAGEPGQLMAGVGWAIGAALGLGFGYWIVGFQVTPHLGGVTHVLVVRTSSLVWLTLFFIVSGKHELFHAPPNWRVLGFIVVGSTCANLAYVANNIGYTTGQVGIVSVLASMNSAVAVLLAWQFLKERLRPTQWAGVILVLIGVAFISVG